MNAPVPLITSLFAVPCEPAYLTDAQLLEMREYPDTPEGLAAVARKVANRGMIVRAAAGTTQEQIADYQYDQQMRVDAAGRELRIVCDPGSWD